MQLADSKLAPPPPSLYPRYFFKELGGEAIHARAMGHNENVARRCGRTFLHGTFLRRLVSRIGQTHSRLRWQTNSRQSGAGPRDHGVGELRTVSVIGAGRSHSEGLRLQLLNALAIKTPQRHCKNYGYHFFLSIYNVLNAFALLQTHMRCRKRICIIANTLLKLRSILITFGHTFGQGYKTASKSAGYLD